jgi:hypothetical protein
VVGGDNEAGCGAVRSGVVDAAVRSGGEALQSVFATTSMNLVKSSICIGIT